MHVARRDDSEAVKPVRVAVRVVATIAIVAAQVPDLLEVAKGDGPEGIAHRTEELLECDWSAGLQQRGEHSGSALGRDVLCVS